MTARPAAVILSCPLIARSGEKGPMARLALLGVAVALLIVGRVDAARFVPLGGPLGAVNPHSNVYGVSAEGSIVVGALQVGTQAHAFRWTEEAGMEILGIGANGPKPRIATAISGNGQAIIGELDDGDPYRWTQAGGLETLAPRLDEPAAISFDGSQVFARARYEHAYGGTVHDVSWDGSVVVGQSFSEGFRDEDGVRTWIGDLPGSTYSSFGWAVSPDGEMIVGGSKGVVNVAGQATNAELPTYWTEAGGIVRLGSWINGYATDISQAKIVIVGYGNPSLGADGAFRWTPETGTRSIRELLLAEGIDVAAQGWDLATNLPTAVSADGRIIVGTGKNPSGRNEPWLIELSIPGDFDDDGDSDGSDFLLWQRGLGATHDAADLTDWRANIEFAMSLAPSSAAVATTAVPEPSSGLLAVFIALAGCRRQRVGPSLEVTNCDLKI